MNVSAEYGWVWGWLHGDLRCSLARGAVALIWCWSSSSMSKMGVSEIGGGKEVLTCTGSRSLGLKVRFER